MAICRFCGVEYDDSLITCPLCNGDEKRSGPISPADILDISKGENKRQLWELTMVLLFSAMIIALAIDGVFGKKMLWSLYANVSLLYVASILTVTHFSKNYWIVSSSLFISTLALLFALNMLTMIHNWFLPIALPITSALYFFSLIVVFLASKSKYKGLNLIAIMFFALAVFVLVVESSIDLYKNSIISLQWSVAAAASLSLLAFILVYIHYRLKRGRKLESLFHV
jgi:hypothetical protein